MAYGDESSNEDWAAQAEGETVRQLSAALERLIARPEPPAELTDAEAERLQGMFLSEPSEADDVDTEPGVSGYAAPGSAGAVVLNEIDLDVVIVPEVIELGSDFEEPAPLSVETVERVVDLAEPPVALKIERPASVAAAPAIGEYRSGPRLIKLHLDNLEGARKHS